MSYNNTLIYLLVFLGWNATILFLHDRSKPKSRNLNFLLLLAIIILITPSLLALNASKFGDKNITIGETRSMIFLLNLLTLPIGGILYLVFFIQKISFSQKINLPQKQWTKFLTGYVFIPLLMLSIAIISNKWNRKPEPKSPYAGFSNLEYTNSNDAHYPNDILIQLTYKYGGKKHQVKAKKSFLCDGQYEMKLMENTEAVLPYFRKHGLWVYFNEQGDTTKTELFENNVLIAAKIFK